MGGTPVCAEESHVDSVAIRVINVIMVDRVAMYEVEIAAAAATWTVSKRYSDFLTLDAALKAKFPIMDFPPLPPKVSFGGTMLTVMVARKAGFEQYLQVLVRIGAIWTDSTLAKFLDDHRNSMYKICPAMRRAQARERAQRLGPSLTITGAQGPNAGLINGTYDPAEGSTGAMPHFKRRGPRDGRLVFRASNNKWWVQSAEKKGKASGYASLRSDPPRLPHLTRGLWQVYDLTKWTTQVGVTVSEVSPSLSCGCLSCEVVLWVLLAWIVFFEVTTTPTLSHCSTTGSAPKRRRRPE